MTGHCLIRMKAPNRIIILSLFAALLFSEHILSARPFRFGENVALSVVAASQQAGATSPEGAALYKQRCAVCHDEPQDRVPPLFLINQRSADDIIQTLTYGSMKQHAAGP